MNSAARLFGRWNSRWSKPVGAAKGHRTTTVTFAAVAQDLDRLALSPHRAELLGASWEVKADA